MVRRASALASEKERERERKGGREGGREGWRRRESERARKREQEVQFRALLTETNPKSGQEILNLYSKK